MTNASVLSSRHCPPGNAPHTRLRRRWSELYDRTVDELGDAAVARPRLRALRQLSAVIDRLEPT